MSTGDKTPIATPSQTVGPFFHFGLTDNASRSRMVDLSLPAETISLVVRVTDGDGQPVSDAILELWHVMPHHADGQQAPGFGRMATDESGACEFETVIPGRLPDSRGGSQASHISVCLFARGLLRQLHTRIYFAGDPGLQQDAVMAIIPVNRRDTLLARRDDTHPDRWVFDLRLQGARETVFFDG